MLARIRSLWRALVRRAAFERDMDEELRLHLQMRTEDLIRRGRSPADAARQAHLEFGGVEVYKERIRDSRALRAIDDLQSDFRYAPRRSNWPVS